MILKGTNIEHKLQNNRKKRNDSEQVLAEVKRILSEDSLKEVKIAGQLSSKNNARSNNFDFDLLEVKEVSMGKEKVAGVSTPVLKDIQFIRHAFSLFNRPAWFPAGMELLKQWIELALQHKVMLQKVKVLEFARKKTTQKVNLYEKVQIPGYKDAIRKIERYLEDEENLAKAAQKIVKKRSNSKAL